MPVHSKSNLLVVLTSTLLLILLLSAAALMYRWINRLNQADRQQETEFLETAMHSFQGEFSGAVQEILLVFRPACRRPANTALEPYLSDLYSQWQSTSHWPQIVGTVGIGTVTSDGILTFRRFRPQDGQFEDQAWPASLESSRDLLRQRLQESMLQPPFPHGESALVLSTNPPVIVLPLASRTTSGPKPLAGLTPRGSRPSRAEPPTQPIGWCFLELDLEFIQRQFLPTLVEGHFGGAGLSRYRLAVVTGHPRQVLYRSDPALTPETLASVDATATLLSHQVPFGRSFPAADGPITKASPKGKGLISGGGGLLGPAANAETQGMDANSGADVWQLVAKHKSGSLDRAMNAPRRRNLGIGFGLLLLLGSSMALLVLTTYRARTLAKQQMEFVAGVSHELRTPLTVIRSAGFNLAKGLIGDPRRVQQYGAIIQREGRRLSDMVEQILMYAGIQSSRKHYELKPAHIPEIIDRALADYTAAFEEAGWHVEKNVEQGLPPVLTDAQALESAIKNLLQNVLKYASDGKWLRVSASATQNKKGSEVEVTVEDHGPGIDPVDLPHIFDPFYRGRKVLASPISGVGLGLSLLQSHIEAHRGRVTVRTAPGQGAAFTLHLPALSHPEGVAQSNKDVCHG
jgi:signal transduction histidine kinase